MLFVLRTVRIPLRESPGDRPQVAQLLPEVAAALTFQQMPAQCQAFSEGERSVLRL